MIEKANLNYYDAKIAGPVSSKDLFSAYKLLSGRESSFQQSNISAASLNNCFTSVASNLAAKFEINAFVKPKIKNNLNTAIFSVAYTNEVVKVIQDF